jgi:membrane fusion protein (multidrug efflux system)
VFSVDAFPNREFKGKVDIIYPNVDEHSRMLKVEALIPNRSLELKPGFFSRVMVYTGAQKEAVLIPITSILYEGTKVRVFLNENNKARERYLKLGRKYGEMMEITEGLQAGEKLVVVGQNTLTDGVNVRVVK